MMEILFINKIKCNQANIYLVIYLLMHTKEQDTV